MPNKPSLEDIVGIGHSKLGFFKELQHKIEELNRSNMELMRQRKHVQAIVDGIADIVAVISTDYRIRSVNHSYYDIYSGDNPAGRHCYAVFRGRNRPCEQCALKDALEANAVRRQSAIVSVNGENRHFEITASPFGQTDGLPGEIIVVKRDVTREKELRAKYYHAEKMATIGLLAAGVAHEINNPLTAIQGFTDGLRRRMEKLAPHIPDETVKADFNEYLAIIRDECRRCSDIVRSLLTFSPRSSAEFSRVALNRVIDNVLRIIQNRLKQQPGLRIDLALDENLPMVNGLPEELTQVILNLVLNAMDAIADQGTITLRTVFTPEKNSVSVEVADTGCGIAPEKRSKLFEPFYTTKPVGKGTGIGLSTCYHIIGAHGGEIAVESTPGAGSVFRVSLPAAEESARES